MKQEFLFSAVLLVSACASIPEEIASREYRREAAQIEATERFEALKRACAKAGGTVRMKRMSSGRMAPTAIELQAATCAGRHPSAVQF